MGPPDWIWVYCVGGKGGRRIWSLLLRRCARLGGVCLAGKLLATGRQEDLVTLVKKMCVAFFRCLSPKPPHFENAFHKAPCFPQYNRLQPARLTIFTVVPGVALQQLCTSVICVVSGRAFSFTFPEERLVSRTLTSFDVTSVCNMLVSLLAGGKRAIEVNEPLIDSTCHQSFSFDFIEKEP